MSRQELFSVALASADKARELLERGRSDQAEEWTKLGHLYLKLAEATPPTPRPARGPWVSEPEV
jgi:hypothetical protein